jgi:hypothetical protein
MQLNGMLVTLSNAQPRRIWMLVVETGWSTSGSWMGVCKYIAYLRRHTDRSQLNLLQSRRTGRYALQVGE